MRAGERLRLRLINAANARIFALEFQDHRPTVIALDGQPVEPHEPDGGRVVLGPAMRADLVIDMSGRPGERFPSSIRSIAASNTGCSTSSTRTAPPLREQPLDAPMRLAANTMPEPDLAAAERHEITFGGGMMGGMMDGGGMGGMMRDGMMGDMMRGMRHSASGRSTAWPRPAT